MILKASSSPDTCQGTSEPLFDTFDTTEENGDQGSQPCPNHLPLVRSLKRLKFHVMLTSSLLSLRQKMSSAAGCAC